MYLQSRSDISSDLKGGLNKTFAIDIKLESLDTNMNKTKETLKRESYKLRIVQENLYSQEATLDNLNTNFKTLEDIVKSLSVVVDRLEETLRTGITGHSPEALLSDNPADSRGWLTLPPKTYPKGTLLLFIMSSSSCSSRCRFSRTDWTKQLSVLPLQNKPQLSKYDLLGVQFRNNKCWTFSIKDDSGDMAYRNQNFMVT